jgi:hypothetical protein
MTGNTRTQQRKERVFAIFVIASHSPSRGYPTLSQTRPPRHPNPSTNAAAPKASEKLQIVGLEQLLSLKLDSSAHSPLRRLRDKTDVVELILRRKLPRDLAVAPAVRSLYLETWDALQAEP